MSGLGIVHSGKCPSGKCPSGNCLSGNFPSGKCLSGKCPVIERTNERTNIKTISLKLLCEKEQQNKWKMAISSIFPVFSAGKKILSKIGLGHVMSIAITHLCAKNWKKTNDEISRKCQKTGFSGIFPAFSAGKNFFRKSGSVTFWALPFCIIVPKIRKN